MVLSKLSEIFSNKKQKNELAVSKMSQAISLWCDMYENKQTSSSDISKSLNLASAISSELSRLTTLEFSSQILGSKRADYLNEQYQKIIKKSRTFVEYACAKGGVILKPYLENDKIMVSIIQPDAFFPTSFTNDGEIDGIVFYEVFSDNDFYYTRLEEHRLFDNCLTIKNTAYKSKYQNELGKEVPIKSVGRWSMIEPFCRIENIQRPLFSYFKMPMANSVDSTSGLGVSAYSNACGLIEDAYSLYSNLLWEFESGKRALYLDECAVRRDEDGSVTLPDKRLYRMLSSGNDELFQEWSPQIRQADILKGLDKILRSIEFNCGLAYGTLSDPQSIDKTAEEIKASKQRSYSTICDIQNSLKKALEDLVFSMNVFCDIYSLAPGGEYNISFSFDDSIVSNRQEEFSEKVLLLEKGVLTPWELRAWYTGEDEETAKKRLGDGYKKTDNNTMAQN